MTVKVERITGQPPPCTIAVLGLGNLLRTDDGAGIHAIRRLQEDGRLPADVQIIEGGTLGLNLLPSLQGITHVLALDAVETGAPPGTLSRFSGTGLDLLPVAKSVHLLGFADLLGSLKLLGQAPSEVVLLGVQPYSTEWGVALSQPVEAALDQLVETAFAQVGEWVHAADGHWGHGECARISNEFSAEL